MFVRTFFAERRALVSATILLLFVVGVLSVGNAPAQNRNIMSARARIRERMIREQAGQNPSVRFNDNESFESISPYETRVRGTGTYYWYSNDRGRDFSYTAVFEIRSGNLRSLNYSFSGNGGGNNPDPGTGQIIYCGSEDGRRHECSVDTSAGVSLSAQRSEAQCVQGRTWGFRRGYIWVDRGCRGDFLVAGNNNNDDYEQYHAGSVVWRGRVDHDVKLVIYGDRIDTYVLSGKDLGIGTYQFTSPMPRRATVSVRKVKGRNDVTIAEQPSRFNKFSAIIHITDKRGGKDDTEVVVSW
jgi:hypothetical protein